MDNIAIRRGRTEDAQHFSELAMFTGPELLPYLLGSKVEYVLEKSFQHEMNCFSFEHAHFIEVNGETVGMALTYSYSQKKEEGRRSAEIISRYLEGSIFSEDPEPRMPGGILGQVSESDSYLSNLAVYPKFRSLGFGTKLFEVFEEEARAAGSKRMVLDAETDNHKAVKLYERHGYNIEKRSPVIETSVKNFEFFKMGKEL